MNKWRPLDLRSKEPQAGKLVAIRLLPKNDRATFYKSENYAVGHFETEGKKTWWRTSHSTEDPVRLKQHYDIWWCSVPEFDGI